MTKAAIFHSYLFAFLFWAELSLGCLSLNLVFQIVSGRWSVLIKRTLAAGTSSVWLVAALFVPILFGLDQLFPWASPNALHVSELAKKAAYLNVPFFIGRNAFYFACWLVLTLFLTRAARLRLAAPRLGAGGFVLFGFTASFAAVDWMMSLNEQWYSTMFGLLRVASEGLTAMAFCIAVAAVKFVRVKKVGEIEITSLQWIDLGNLLLTTTLLWAYTSFSQFLITWTGNLPKEVQWYYARAHGGWQWEIIAVALLRFAIPFFLLLFKQLKRNPKTLALIALMPIVMHFVEIHWLVGPAFSPGHLRFSVLDVLLWAVLGALWFMVFVAKLERPYART